MLFEQFSVGLRYPLPPVLITREEILRFAGQYDPLPFHVDEDYAAASHFGALIAPGLMSFASIWAGFARMNVWGDDLIGGLNTKIEWFAPVFAGDTLSGEARVSAVTRKNDRCGIVQFTLDIQNQNGVQVMRDVTDTMVCAEGTRPPAGAGPDGAG